MNLASDPVKNGAELNVVLLPGAADELANPAPGLAYAISDAGVVLIGRRAQISARTVLAIYDLRDLIKRLAFKSTQKPPPTAAEFQAAVVKVLHDNVEPQSWGEIDKSPASLTPYEGLLIVFATPEVHRIIVAGLQDMNK